MSTQQKILVLILGMSILIFFIGQRISRADEQALTVDKQIKDLSVSEKNFLKKELKHKIKAEIQQKKNISVPKINISTEDKLQIKKIAKEKLKHQSKQKDTKSVEYLSTEEIIAKKKALKQKVKSQLKLKE